LLFVGVWTVGVVFEGSGTTTGVVPVGGGVSIVVSRGTTVGVATVVGGVAAVVPVGGAAVGGAAVGGAAIGLFLVSGGRATTLSGLSG
jgi:hypothetical protein